MRKLRILLAEDNDADVLLVREALAEHRVEHDLKVISDGARALEYMDNMGTGKGQPCPDVLLLDLNLPKVDGHQVLQQFRAHPECRSKPVIIVTSSDAARDRDRAAALGATKYFRKSSEFDEFMALGALVKEVAGGRDSGS